MYEKTHEFVSTALQGAPVFALVMAFVWGILSIILSPCHLSSIPLIIAFISGQGGTTARRAFTLSSLFSVGILVTIALIGVITATAGTMMGNLGPYPSYIVAVVFFIIGLHLLDAIPIPFVGPKGVKMKQKGHLASFILGLVFGLALGPCTFSFMIPILAVTLLKPGSNTAFSALLLFAYGIGHCAVIAFAGTSTELVQRYLNWNEGSGAAAAVRKICGCLVLFGGIYLIYKA